MLVPTTLYKTRFTDFSLPPRVATRISSFMKARHTSSHVSDPTANSRTNPKGERKTALIVLWGGQEGSRPAPPACSYMCPYNTKPRLDFASGWTAPYEGPPRHAGILELRGRSGSVLEPSKRQTRELSFTLCRGSSVVAASMYSSKVRKSSSLLVCRLHGGSRRGFGSWWKRGDRETGPSQAELNKEYDEKVSRQAERMRDRYIKKTLPWQRIRDGGKQAREDQDRKMYAFRSTFEYQQYQQQQQPGSSSGGTSGFRVHQEKPQQEQGHTSWRGGGAADYQRDFRSERDHYTDHSHHQHDYSHPRANPYFESNGPRFVSWDASSSSSFSYSQEQQYEYQQYDYEGVYKSQPEGVEQARAILGLDVPMSKLRRKDVKRAYKKKALLYHPDIQGGSDDAFRELGAARDVLFEHVLRE
jgi:hypothetical protein